LGAWMLVFLVGGQDVLVVSQYNARSLKPSCRSCEQAGQ
jgi:hypothetical protein